MSRGRVSGAELAALAAMPTPIESQSRLACPVHLSDAVQAVWAELVNDVPGGSFTAKDIPLLEAYCRHVVQGRIIADQIESFDPAWLGDDEGLKRFDRLTAIGEREARAASSLATRLRITRQAMVDPKTAGRANSGLKRSKKPWESGGSE